MNYEYQMLCLLFLNLATKVVYNIRRVKLLAHTKLTIAYREIPCCSALVRSIGLSVGSSIDSLPFKQQVTGGIGLRIRQSTVYILFINVLGGLIHCVIRCGLLLSIKEFVEIIN